MGDTSRLDKYKWKKGQSGNPKGKPRKLFNQMAAEFKAVGIERVTQSQVQEAIEIIIALTTEEMDGLLKAKNIPEVYKIMIRALKSARGLDSLDKLLDRAHGKAVQTTNLGASDATKGFKFVVEVEKEDGFDPEKPQIPDENHE